MTNPSRLTDFEALRRRRWRASRNPVSFLHEVVASELEERLNEVNKTFSSPLLIGHAPDPVGSLFTEATRIEDTANLSIEAGCHDLVIHSMGLHWADDPVGQLIQSRMALEPDGLFLGVMFGGETLTELRRSLAEAESRLLGGISPRVAPMADVREIGGLLQRAGLALPVADLLKLKVRYPSLAKLVEDLRGMGETNVLSDRHRVIPPRQLFSHAEEFYRRRFSDEEDYLIATFDLIFLTGWSPASTQPQPLRPGSANSRLADALGVSEQNTGDPVAPRIR